MSTRSSASRSSTAGRSTPTIRSLAEYRKLFQKLEDPCVLYLALLLHDTGKASNAKVHAEASALFAQKVAAPPAAHAEQRKSLVLLVDNHIVLSMTAQRRNLDDPATIAEFAGLIKNQPNLDALMLLTLADGQGTGDENWSDWKEGLVWQLYRSTSLYLADGEAFYRQRHDRARGAARSCSQEDVAAISARKSTRISSYMPERYFQTYGVAEIVEHIRLFRTFLEAPRQSTTASPLAPAREMDRAPEHGPQRVLVLRLGSQGTARAHRRFALRRAAQHS